MLPHPYYRLHRLLLVLLGIDLGDGRGSMAEDNPGCFQAEFLSQECSSIVSKLVRVPVLLWLPGGKFLIGHTLWPKRLLNGIGNGMAITSRCIVLTGLPTGSIFDIGARPIPYVQRGLAVGEFLLPPFGHGLGRRETIRLFRSQ